MKHDVIAMVGLPARGKTYISRSIVNYLNGRGFECRVFNVGEYRRLSTDYSAHDFFSTENEHALQLRNKIAIDALEDLCSWLAKGDNRVAIYDATNSTKDRREIIYDTVVCKYNYNLLFIESICNKPNILDVNIRVSHSTFPRSQVIHLLSSFHVPSITNPSNSLCTAYSTRQIVQTTQDLRIKSSLYKISSKESHITRADIDPSVSIPKKTSTLLCKL